MRHELHAEVRLDTSALLAGPELVDVRLLLMSVAMRSRRGPRVRILGVAAGLLRRVATLLIRTAAGLLMAADQIGIRARGRAR